MKSKDKKIKELKKDLSNSEVISITFIILFLIISVIIVIVGNEKNRLESQLQSCQEKVPVWTLKVECDGFISHAYPPFLNSTIIVHGRGQEDYKRTLEGFQEYENCEVLE